MGKRGQKICPKCGTTTGPRSYNCPNEACDHVFIKGKTKKAPYKPSGAGYGRKKCPECGNFCGARCFLCPHCEYNFKPGQEKKTYVPVKRRLKKNEEKVVDWENLENGTKIRVLKDSGDYYIGEDGEKIYMQDHGEFLVKGRDANGLRVYGKTGFGYVYMGQPCRSKTFSEIHKQPCEIVVVN